MLRSTAASARGSRAGIFERLWRYSRTVEVDIYDWGLAVDSFSASDPAALRESLMPVYKHPGEARGLIRLIGVEKRSLPFGLGESRREVSLDDLTKAICFLEG